MTERIKTPHPHAGLMMEYAKDCLTDSEAAGVEYIEYHGWRPIESAPEQSGA